MVTLTRWQDSAEAAVTDFVVRHPEGLIYYSPVYRRFLLDLLKCRCFTLLAWEGSDLVGVLPLMARDGPYGTVLNSLPFFGSNGGPLAIDGESAAVLREGYEQQVADPSIAAATWISHPFDPGAGPRHDVTDERIAQWTDLTEVDAGTNLPAGLEGSTRRNIRKAEMAAITVRETPDALLELEHLHRRNMRSIGGQEKPSAFFSAVAKVFEFGRDWTLYVAERSGSIVAALLLFQHGRTVEYVMPGFDDETRHLQPTSLLVARAMQDAMDRGFRRWNWGGTWLSQDGVHRFKRKWGAREGRYRYYIRIKNQALLDRSPADLGQAYPYFYTAPYRLFAGKAS